MAAGTWYGNSNSDYDAGEAMISADGINWSPVPVAATDLHFATYVMP
jgi:hypothetical protein